jgi:hypothetical protein
MFVHTLNTWLLAQLLHPFVFLLYFFFRSPEEINLAIGLFVGMISIIFYISIPSLLIARSFLGLLSRMTVPVFEKLFIWIIVVELSIFLNFSGSLLLFDGQIRISEYKLMIPPMIAAFFAILIRAKQFFSFQLNYKSVKNENEMV